VSDERGDDGFTRREAIKITAGAAAAVPLLAGAAPAARPRFFTSAELALLDELTEMIVPADAQSGGARAAKVAAFIDQRLSEAVLAPDLEAQKRWRDGLARVDALAREMHGGAFLAGTPAQRLAVLTRMAANEADPKSPEEQFFRELKGRTIHAYYTSRVGIHDDLQYKGNTMQEQYAGEVPTD
jgi:glucoside 3-dehydrogenase (cytochrome c) hitch-hiker subunit